MDKHGEITVAVVEGDYGSGGRVPAGY